LACGVHCLWGCACPMVFYFSWPSPLRGGGVARTAWHRHARNHRLNEDARRVVIGKQPIAKTTLDTRSTMHELSRQSQRAGSKVTCARTGPRPHCDRVARIRKHAHETRSRGCTPRVMYAIALIANYLIPVDAGDPQRGRESVVRDRPGCQSGHGAGALGQHRQFSMPLENNPFAARRCRRRADWPRWTHPSGQLLAFATAPGTWAGKRHRTARQQLYALLATHL